MDVLHDDFFRHGDSLRHPARSYRSSQLAAATLLHTQLVCCRCLLRVGESSALSRSFSCSALSFARTYVLPGKFSALGCVSLRQSINTDLQGAKDNVHNTGVPAVLSPFLPEQTRTNTVDDDVHNTLLHAPATNGESASSCHVFVMGATLSFCL